MQWPNPTLLIATGAILGTGLRWGIERLQPDASWPLILINVAGSALLGWILGRGFNPTSSVRLLFGVGFAGAFTSFSSFCLAVASSLDATDWSAAMVTVVATAVPAVLASVLGYQIGARR